MNNNLDQRTVRPMSLLMAIAPIVTLIVALSWNVYIFGDDAISGSSQIVILFVAGITAIIGLAHGVSWNTIQEGVVKTIGHAIPSILILLLVGSLASIWLLSGTLPLLIYYGIKILNPTIFLMACCISCALVAVFTGSSWSTTATIGVAMVGIGKALGVPEALIGGAVISGAYFGDKVSPLSDTTNLAAAVTETPLFEHIRYLFYTTGPSALISLILFGVIGISIDTAGQVDVSNTLVNIESTFNISVWLLLPPIIVLALIIKKVPAIPALFFGVVAGVLLTLMFQQKLLTTLITGSNHGSLYHLLATTLYSGIQIPTENAILNDLFSASGMGGMLNVICLTIAAMTFGGIMEASGMLVRIMHSIKNLARSFFGLVSCTASTCLITNASTSDQYISVVIPGQMYAGLYKDMGYASKNLSRTIEDSGTVTSVLIPWNTCGAYHAAVLGVGTLTYLPFCFFNILSPVMTLVMAFTMTKIERLKTQSNASV